MKCVKKILFMFMIAVTIMLGNCTYGFAQQNYRINNTNLTFSKIIYVDVNGDDSYGNGTIENPFKSLYKCLSYLNENNLKENVAIVMGDGEYDWTEIATGVSNNIKSEFQGMKVSFIAKNPGNAFISSNNGLEVLVVENNSNLRIKFNFYGLVFHNITGDNNTSCLGGDSWMNEYYNCVFDKLSLDGWNAVDKDACIKTQNCLFVNCKGNIYNGFVSGEGINNASTNDIIEPIKGSKTTCLDNVIIESDYSISSGGWENKGTGINPDGTYANIGVYGGEFAWGDWTRDTSNAILSISPENDAIDKGEEVYADINISNISKIAAEDIRIKYDSSKLKLLELDQVDGIKLVKKEINDGELRVILVSKGKANISNSKKTLLKLKFKGISTGDALVSIIKGRISDGINMEEDLFYDECGEATIAVEDYKDPNKDGEFTLLDLAIDGRYYGQDPAELPEYKADVVEDGIIDDDDLIRIGEYMVENPNYKF